MKYDITLASLYVYLPYSIPTAADANVWENDGENVTLSS